MNEERLITVIIAAIIFIQIIVFLRTVSKINLFKKIFFPKDCFKTYTVYISTDEIKDINPGTITGHLWKYIEPAGKDEIDDRFEITLIDTTKNRGIILDRILDSLNTYLIRNKGAVSDFDLMKDIVERNCEAIDEEVNASLPVPLYLGLMGTMIGIVVGLYFVTADSLTSETTIASIGGLIGGVRIAMLSSFAGLLCTTTGQGFLYKRVKAQVENKKHAFYTFLQTELLPVLNENVNPTIDKLQRNLSRFNEKFSENTGRFETLLRAVNDSFESQTEFLRLVKEMNIKHIANANINVLKELKGSIGEIGKFNSYLNQINSFVANAEKLNGSLLAQLERTSSVETIVNSIEMLVIRIEKITTESAALTQFLNSHFAELDRHSLQVNEAINKHSLQMNHAIIDVDNNLKHGVDSFADFTRERIDVLRRFVIDEEVKLTARLEETSGLLEELKNLSNVKESMKNMETLSGEQKALTEMQNTKLDNLTNSIDKLVDVLKTPAGNRVEQDAPVTDNKNEMKIIRRLLWIIAGCIIAGITIIVTVVALYWDALIYYLF